MATAKPAAKPAAKTAAPAAKTPAAKPAVKAVAKAAPAPAPVEPEATEAAAVEPGSTIKFLGYAPDTPENEQALTAGAEYPVSEVTAEGNIVVQCPNPEFNAKKKEDVNTNPKFLEVEVLPDEAELVSGPPEAAAAEAAPVGKKATKAVKVAAVKEETPPEEPVDPDDLPELENEDESVMALVSGSEDLIATAQELEKEVSDTEFKLGGILFHIRKDKLHRNVAGEDGKPVAAYSENKGWETFIGDFFNIDYRKAMYLIEIYQNFTLAKIENAAEHVAAMGWTKASKIAKHLVAEGANPGELIELAETSTVSDLVEAIKESITVGGTPGEKKVRITLKFRYVEEEANAIQTTLEAARDQLGLKDIGEALAHIVTEWGTQNAGGKATAKSAPAQKTAAAGAKPVAKAVAKRAPAAATA
jgi:hypothetical protein